MPGIMSEGVIQGSRQTTVLRSRRRGRHLHRKPHALNTRSALSRSLCIYLNQHLDCALIIAKQSVSDW